MIFPVKESLMFIERYPLGLRDKGHLGSSYFSTPNPSVGAVFTYYVKDDSTKLRDLRLEQAKAKGEKGEKVYYPSMDSLRMEDSQPDPYLLFTIRDKAGDVVRHLKAPAKKGLQKIVWDFRYATPAPVLGRVTLAPDQLFGGEEKGHLAMPGEYTVSLSKYEDGKLTELAGPVTFTCKLLQQSSLPVNMEENVKFYKQVAALRKAASATTDIFNNMRSRLNNINAATNDMLAAPKSILEKAYALMQELNRIGIQLNGDQSVARREFETVPSINGRIGDVEGGIWNSTSMITETFKKDYAIASKGLTTVLTAMRKLDTEIKALEKELDLNKAPYTPGRWPEWEGGEK